VACLSNNVSTFTTRALAVQTNGNILVGGNFNTAQSCANAITRLRTNGSIDSTFSSPFFSGDLVSSIAVLPNGKIIVGGNMRDNGTAFGVARLNARGVTHISGTPSHWRRLLTSGSASGFSPRYVRLSSEIADQAVLDGLGRAFPEASIEHAYASTEAGVGFAVNDGPEGFSAHNSG